MVESRRVAVLGLGYVGCVHAAGLAEMGHRVAGCDRDPHKVGDILAGRAPFYEPGLGELIGAVVRAGSLTATLSMAEALENADAALIAVGTPSGKNGDINVEQLRRVAEEMAAVLEGRTAPLAAAVCSTVFPGTCEQVLEPIFRACPGVSVVANPEFLREGSALQDFRQPPLIVIGGANAAAVRTVAELYEPLGVAPSLVSLRAAEMIKYACNAFHALKIAFANEIGAACEPLGIDAGEVMRAFCCDRRLNISAAYLQPGFAFGGSCLPKDLRALTYRASRLDVKLPLLEAVLPSNQEHFRRAVEKVLELPAQRVGVVGLAFKENTDDLRESAVVALLEHLIGKGRSLRVYDPHIQLERIYGSNRSFILDAIPHIGRLLQPRLEDVLGWAEQLVIAQRVSPQMAEVIAHCGISVIDLTDSFSRLLASG